MAVVPHPQPSWQSNLAHSLKQTPGRLTLMGAVIVLATMIVFFVQKNAVDETRQTIQTITKDSVPSVIAAQQIRYGFHKLNGDTMATYLAAQNGIPVHYDLEADRREIADQLVAAAKNITYGEDEAGPIRTMIQRLPQYSVITSEALKENGPKAAHEFTEASKLLHQELVANAQKLDDVNRKYLDEAFEHGQSTLGGTALTANIFALALVGALVVVQLRVMKISHRFINAPLMAATVVAIVLLIEGAIVLSHGASRMRAAKQDAFDSMSFLSQARADAMDARSQELLGLVSPTNSQPWEEFHKQSQLLADTDQINLLTQTYNDGDKPSFKGLLGNELANITFPGEREAANEELHAYASFINAVNAEKDLVTQGNSLAAAKAALSPSDSTPDARTTEALVQSLDNAIQATNKINSDEFDMTRDLAFAGLSTPVFMLPILCLLVVGLSLFGIRQRVGEYAIS